MDLAEYRRLSVRVVATRNVETRAFLKAFDLAPGSIGGWSERASSDWRAWNRANEALRGAVAELEAYLAPDRPDASSPDESAGR
jgi:hypothetical protein